MNFLILAHPRTGSTHLCTKFNSIGDVVCHYELFNSEAIFYASDRKLDRSAESLGFTVTTRDRNPDLFLEQVRSLSEGKITGFKIFPGHNDAVAMALIRSNEVKKFVLYRENVLAAFASNKEAAQIRIFNSKLGEEHLFRPKKVVFYRNEFQQFWDRYVAWYQKCLGALLEHKQSFVLLPYHAINDPYHIAAAMRHLGLETSGDDLPSPFVKTGSRQIVDRFENREDVSEFLRANDLIPWMHEQPFTFDRTTG